MPTTINSKLLNTNKHVVFPSVSLTIWQPFSPSSHYKTHIKTQIQKPVSFPAADSTQEMAEVFWRQPKMSERVLLWAEPVWGVDFVHTAGGWQGRGIPAGDNCQGSKNLRSACSLVSPQLEQQTTFFWQPHKFFQCFSRPGDDEHSCTLNPK